MKRRHFLQGAAATVASSAVLGHGRRAHAHDSPPNVLMIVTDQQRYPWHLDPALLELGMRGQQLLRALGATTFHQHMTTSPFCSPARSTLWTGLYPTQTGVLNNLGLEDYNGRTIARLDSCIDTIGDRLGPCYTRGYFGKWHLDKFTCATKMAGRGFDHYQRNDTLSGDYGAGSRDDTTVADQACTWLSERPAAGEPWLAAVNLVNPHDITGAPYMPADLKWGDSVANLDALTDGRISNPPQGIELAAPRGWNQSSAALGKPATMVHAFEHDTIYGALILDAQGRFFTPRDDSRPFSQFGEGDWLSYVAAYIQLIWMVEEQIERVVSAVPDQAMDNTLIIVTSDHGDQGGNYGLPCKGIWMTKELLHVPLLIKPPGAPYGQDITRLTSHVDLVPTICGFAGVPAPAASTGIDLRAVLEDPWAGEPRAVYAQLSSGGPDPIEVTADARTVLAEVGDGTLVKYSETRSELSDHVERELYYLVGDDEDELDNLAGTGELDEASMASLLVAGPLADDACWE